MKNERNKIMKKIKKQSKSEKEREMDPKTVTKHKI